MAIKLRSRAYIYMIVSLFTGAFLPIVLAKAKDVNIFQFFMLAYLVTIPMALLLVALTKKNDKVIEYLKDKKQLSIIVLVGFLSYIPIEFAIAYAERFVSASLATVVFRTSPLLMLVFIPPILKEKLSKSQILALLLAFIGIYVALTGGNLITFFSNPDLPIVVFLIVAALGYALSGVLSKKYTFDMESAVLLFNTSLFVLFTALFLLGGAQATRITTYDMLAILYVSVANNIIGFYMYFSALRILKTTFVTNFFFLSPFITFLFANLILGESIKLYYILIAVLVAIGLIIQRFDKLGGAYAQRSNRDRFVIFDITGAFVDQAQSAIFDVIEKGGRVLAVKLRSRHYKNIKKVIEAGNYDQVYTNLDESIKNEAKTFIEDIMDPEKNEIIVMKAGEPEESENFFDSLHESLPENGKEL